jgi:uncharacterized protein
VWSRVGAGSAGAGLAALGLALGATVISHGPLLQLNRWLTSTSTRLPASIDAVLALPRWLTIVSLVGALALGLAGRVRGGGAEAWPWPLTGLALGVVGVLAWLSGSIAGWDWGLSITGPSRSLVESTVLRMPGAAGWGTGLIVGIPIGTWVSARAQGPITWRLPGRAELGRRFAGGVLMGVGGTLAAGCNIGNALTGLSVLALNSVIATAAIVTGAALAVAWPGICRRIPGLPMTRRQR